LVYQTSHIYEESKRNERIEGRLRVGKGLSNWIKVGCGSC